VLDVQLGPHRRPFHAGTPAQGRVFNGPFAYDAETTRIVEGRPDLTPRLVLASARDERVEVDRGWTAGG
jgi:hypothetical protein